MSDEDKELVDLEYKFSLQKFLIGWAKIVTDKAAVVWGVFTWLGYTILKNRGESIIDIITVSGWILVTTIYLLGRTGFNQMLGNSKIETKIGVGKV